MGMIPYPHAENYYCGAISLPMFQTWTDVQQDKIVSALKVALAS